MGNLNTIYNRESLIGLLMLHCHISCLNYFAVDNELPYVNSNIYSLRQIETLLDVSAR